MELTLTEDEVKDIIYKWAAETFPGYTFDMLSVEARYNAIQHVTLSQADPSAKEAE